MLMLSTKSNNNHCGDISYTYRRNRKRTETPLVNVLSTYVHVKLYQRYLASWNL